MHYADPIFPVIAGGTFIVIIFYIISSARRRKLTGEFADRATLAQIAPTLSAGKRLFKMGLVTTAVFLCLYSLARPQWGFVWEEAKRSGIDILIAMDVSKSMLATDVKPNRLERSKFAVKDLIKKLDGDRVGLIAFAGTAFLQCPPTIDYNGFLLVLDDLGVGTIPKGGTNISGAISEAVKTFGPKDKKFKALVIITDGDDLEGKPLEAAKEASKAGIRVYCIGVGTAEGELIYVYNERGQRDLVKDRRGDAVKSRLNEELLKEIAVSTGGAYVRATQAEFGLALIYDKNISKLEKSDLDSKMRKHLNEKYQYFLALAILALFIEPLISEARRNHR